MVYIELSLEEKSKLEAIYKKGSDFRAGQRAQALLMSAEGDSIDKLAQTFRVNRDTISNWFRRWREKGLDGLTDLPRSGRPTKLDEEDKKK